MSSLMTASTAPPEGSFLATGRGKVTLALLCAVTFLDVVDGSIVNVALPTIRTHLGFSVQNLQWVVSGYLITYGGFLLLGGRAGDLLGRRRLLIAGTALFAASSLACGLADSQGQLVVTVDTVKKHVSHILGKLGAANRTEAVTRARQLGLIP